MGTKDRLCETAYKLFKEKGYNNVSVDDICKECGVAKTTFYYHLDSKEDTLYPFYNTVADILVGELKNIIAADNYWEQLVICYSTLLKESELLGSELTGLLYTANIKENKGSIAFRGSLDEMFVAIIEKAQEAGQILNKQPAEQIYKAFGYTYIGLEVYWCIYGEEFDRKKVLIEAMESVFEVSPKIKSNK